MFSRLWLRSLLRYLVLSLAALCVLVAGFAVADVPAKAVKIQLTDPYNGKSEVETDGLKVGELVKLCLTERDPIIRTRILTEFDRRNDLSGLIVSDVQLTLITPPSQPSPQAPPAISPPSKMPSPQQIPLPPAINHKPAIQQLAQVARVEANAARGVGDHALAARFTRFADEDCTNLAKHPTITSLQGTHRKLRAELIRTFARAGADMARGVGDHALAARFTRFADEDCTNLANRPTITNTEIENLRGTRRKLLAELAGVRAGVGVVSGGSVKRQLVGGVNSEPKRQNVTVPLVTPQTPATPDHTPQEQQDQLPTGSEVPGEVLASAQAAQPKGATSERLKCPRCPKKKGYATQGTLDRHIAMKHGGEEHSAAVGFEELNSYSRPPTPPIGWELPLPDVLPH